MATYNPTPVLGHLPATAVSLGCFKSDYMPALYFKAYKHNTTSTPLGCFKTCSAKGFQYSGTQNGGDCYCDNTLKLANLLGSDAEGCTTPCTGSRSQTCGGDYRMDITQDTLWVSDSLHWWDSAVKKFKKDH